MAQVIFLFKKMRSSFISFIIKFSNNGLRTKPEDQHIALLVWSFFAAETWTRKIPDR